MERLHEREEERATKAKHIQIHTLDKKNMLILLIIKMLVARLEHLTLTKLHAHPNHYGNMRITNTLFTIFCLLSRRGVSVDTTDTPLSPPLLPCTF